MTKRKGGGGERLKVLFIIGSTGVGKSKLAVDLAKALARQGRGVGYGAEVVSADSMQIYRGNDVSSATVTSEEMDGVPHHLLSFVEPSRQYLIQEFKKEATQKIQDIHRRGFLPIVAGGTMMWIESLIFADLLEAGGNDHKVDEICTRESKSTSQREDPQKAIHDDVAAIIPKDMASAGAKGNFFSMIQNQLDPVMANRLHPNDVRKVRRAVRYYRDTGGHQLSELLSEKRRSAFRTATYDACVIWLTCSKEVLNTRLDKRIDKMMANGLVDECDGLFQLLVEKAAGNIKAFTSEPFGVGQSIGFRQFFPYLEAKRGGGGVRIEKAGKAAEASAQDVKGGEKAKGRGEGNHEQEEEREGEHTRNSRLKDLLQTAVSRLKTATRRYAQKQVKWVRNRLLPCSRTKPLPPPPPTPTPAPRKRATRQGNEEGHGQGLFDLHHFDTSRADLWGEDVLRPSLAIVRAFMLRELQHNAAGEVHGNDKGKDAGYAHGIVKSLKEWKSFECKDCGRTLHGSHEFQEHLKSRGHRKRKAKLAKIQVCCAMMPHACFKYRIERQKRCAADVRKARAMARLQKEEQANK
eukprot:jgi/Bigna1/70910/fgenesh1_pg.13_\